MSRLKVQGFDSLVRDTRSNAIVNTSTSEYKIYMQRRKARENQEKIKNDEKSFHDHELECLKESL